MSSRARQESATTTPADPAEHAREIALRLLTHSARSAGQLRSGLVAREVDPVIADQIVDRYREVGLLDDGELAKTIARTRHREKGASRRAISMELRRKEFAQDDIDAALEQISDDAELDAARTLAAKRWQQLEAHPIDVRVRRVVGMLGRKGHSPSVAFGVVNELKRADISGA